MVVKEEGKTDNRCPLTEREFQVLQLMARGISIDHMAEELFIARATVRTHRRNIRRKLKIKDITARRILIYQEKVELLRTCYE